MRGKEQGGFQFQVLSLLLKSQGNEDSLNCPWMCNPHFIAAAEQPEVMLLNYSFLRSHISQIQHLNCWSLKVNWQRSKIEIPWTKIQLHCIYQTGNEELISVLLSGPGY